MSKYETKDNTGSLFKNEGDRKTERGPDYSGTAMIGGVEHFMDAWLKTADSGRKWMSFSFKVKTKQSQSAQRAPAPAPAPRAQGRDDFADSIPF